MDDVEELLRRLVSQIKMGNLTDDHGHDFKRNRAFVLACEYLDRESDSPGWEGGFADNH